MGFWMQAQFAQDRSDFGTYNPPNDLERSPPLLGSFAAGVEVVPYERREAYQRLSALAGTEPNAQDVPRRREGQSAKHQLA